MNSSYRQLQIFGTAKVLLSRLNSRYSIRESENITRILVEEISGQPYYKVKMDQEICFTQEQYMHWIVVTNAILEGQPMQYALGKTWFMDMELQVSPGVLIPRPETEELALMAKETAENLLKNPNRREAINDSPFKILDVGTGSGCLAVYLAKEILDAQVTAVDISKEAIEVAQKNASIYKVYLEVRTMDFLQASQDDFHGLDMIVSNPPYIPELEKSEMDPVVTEFEPEGALFVPDHDPLLFYKKIASSGKKWLHPWGSILCEVHENLARQTANLFQSSGFQQVEIHKDLQKKERIIRAFLQIA